MANDYESLQHKKLADKFIYFGEVIDTEDVFESRGIKVRITGIDKDIENKNLPPCYPLLPAFFHFVPKVGERVIIFMDRIYNAESIVNQEKRYYLSVTTSQPQRIKYDPFYYTASSNEDDGWNNRETPISEIPQAAGTFATKDVVGLIGRDNTDVLLKDSEVLIRAGKHLKDKNTEYNRKDPVFIQMRYGIDNSSKEKKYKTITRVENIAPEFIIYVTTDNQNRLMVKVINLEDNSTKDMFSAGYDSRKSLITGVKNVIIDFQSKYPKWQLRTSEPELANLPTLFPNNKKIIKEKVENKEQNSYDQFAGSVMNLVAEKINLLSHKSSKNYNLTDPDKQIDEDTQLEINSTAHPLVFGDKLVEFLNLVKEFIANHVHPYHGKAPSQDENVKKILNYNFDDILDFNIRLG